MSREAGERRRCPVVSVRGRRRGVCHVRQREAAIGWQHTSVDRSSDQRAIRQCFNSFHRLRFSLFYTHFILFLFNPFPIRFLYLIHCLVSTGRRGRERILVFG